MAHLRPIYQIATDIRLRWKRPYFGAIPYLDAMFSLHDIHSYYRYESAEIILTYFLANSVSFKGEEARGLKEELRQHLRSGSA